MSANLFWWFVALAVIGVILVFSSAKKEPGVKDYPALMQWGALAVLVGVFGALSDFMSFTAVLLVLVLLSALVVAIDRWILAPRRRATAAEAGFIVDNARGFFPVLLAVFLLRSFLVEPFTIPSSSMRPGLIVGDFILVNKFTYGIRWPILNTVLLPVNRVERGDVVVFNYPPQPKVNYIKRVIGLPGDTVEYRNKRLRINGQLVPEVAAGSYDYVEQGVMTVRSSRFVETQGDKHYPIVTIPTAATLELSQVADFPYRDQCQYDDTGFICTVPPKHYFMMGDNRDNSLDSRYWGFVEDRLLVGKAFALWMNFSDMGRIGKAVQ